MGEHWKSVFAHRLQKPSTRFKCASHPSRGSATAYCHNQFISKAPLLHFTERIVTSKPPLPTPELLLDFITSTLFPCSIAFQVDAQNVIVLSYSAITRTHFTFIYHHLIRQIGCILDIIGYQQPLHLISKKS